MRQHLKRFLTFTLLILAFVSGSTGTSYAQSKPSLLIQTPNGNQAPELPPGYPSGTPVNYVSIWQPQYPTTDDNDVISPSRTVNEVLRTTEYVDGLGRPLQTVSWQTSPGKKDIVAPVVYDEFGREHLKYLPYASTDNMGTIDMDPYNNQKTFYTNSSRYILEQPSLKNEQFFYSRTNFESSPFNRPTSVYAPGNSWVGSSKGTSIEYLFNTIADEVKIWNIANNNLVYAASDNNATVNIPTSPGNYHAGQLFKTVTTDEHGNAVVEYKDKEGKVILKKVQIGPIDADYSGFSGWLSTYYVYDYLGQLRFVIPPKAVANLPSNGVLTTDIISELCFRYEYDERQRMVAKKVPGAGWVFMVYDKRGRLVFTQDANMYSKSPKQWSYILYDQLNRPVQTGIMTYSDTWNALKTHVESLDLSVSSNTTVNGSTTSTTTGDMFIIERENGRIRYEASNSIVFQPGFDSEISADFVAEIITSTPANFSNDVLVNGNPLLVGTAYPLTLTFYDSYSSYSGKTYSTANNSKLDNMTGVTNYPEELPSAASTQVRGMVTVSKVRVLEDPHNLSLGRWMETVSFYDDKGRAVQVHADNYKGGIDVVTSRYDFAGKVINTYLAHNNSSGNISNMRVKTALFYDHAGRLKKVTKQLNDNSTTTRTIVENEYDALGQLKFKKIGQKSASNTSPIENQDFAYNVRGWLKGINWNYPGAGSTTTSQVNISSDKWFGMDLSYDWGFENNGNAANQFNGNIAGMRWKSAGDNKERAFGYNYDKADRLLRADFTQLNSSWGTDPVINFDVKMGDGTTTASAYDENGNIKMMQQWGLKGPSSDLIDKITYKYKEANQLSNKLLAVTEDNSIGGIDNKLGDFTDKNTGDDYSYDLNGNLIQDKNKFIQNIEYNHLNLPYRINVNTDNTSNILKGTITYIYDAVGNKLEKRTKEFGITTNNNTEKQTETTYLGSFVYESNKLQFLGQEEGRIRMQQSIDATSGQPLTAFVYDYFLKDHLGNVRMVLTDEVKQNIYPAATLEGNIATNSFPNAISIEKDYYTINTTNVVDKPLAMPASINKNGGQLVSDAPVNNNPYSNVTANSEKVYKLQATSPTGVTGLGITLKVMAGDRMDIYGNSFWKDNNTSGTNYNVALTEILTGLLGAPSGATAGKGATVSNLTSSISPTTLPNNFLTRTPDPSDEKPMAYINWILFDEQFKYVDGNFSRVGDGNSIKNHFEDLQNIPVTNNGYLYVFCSNQSPVQVFFDNLQVIHTKGALLEETHYYPFGLTMSGINSKASSSLQNKILYTSQEIQSKEFSDGSGLELYDYNARFQDPQLGRFHMVDPHSENYLNSTPYSYVLNNPLKFTDPTGMDTYLSGQAAQDAVAALQNAHSSNASGETNYDTGDDFADNVAQGAMGLHGGENDQNFVIKAILPVWEAVTPQIYYHNRDAIKEGYPQILQKGTGIDKDFADNNRRHAFKTKHGPNPDKSFYSLDEYPYAFTIEGGWGASLRYVPKWEQDIQREQTRLVSIALKHGDRFIVAPISRLTAPSYTQVPYYKINPDGRWAPAPSTINRRDYEILPSSRPRASSQYNPSGAIVGALLTLLRAISFAL